MRRLWLVGLILLGTAVLIPQVLAHAELVSAVPEPGNTVAELTELRLTFSEPIGPNGQIQLHQNFIDAAELAPVVANERELVTAVPPLPNGVYTVQWSVLSADGHPVSGSYSIGVDSSLAKTETPGIFPWVAGAILLVVGMGTAVWLRRKQTR
ncbi:MAG: copper resistance CopC family protein [Candidatus Promineifilaceae bacterium]